MTSEASGVMGGAAPPGRVHPLRVGAMGLRGDAMGLEQGGVRGLCSQCPSVLERYK